MQIFKKFLHILLIFILTYSIASAKRLHPESEYQAAWCGKRNGIMEYKLSDKTRVDCLLPDLAVEFDFANKWAECIGQALYYSKMTNRQAACVLIMENPEKDTKYLNRLRRAVYRKGLDMRTFTIKPEHLGIPVNYTKTIEK